jgi:hypothetical protein
LIREAKPFSGKFSQENKISIDSNTEDMIDESLEGAQSSGAKPYCLRHIVRISRSVLQPELITNVCPIASLPVKASDYAEPEFQTPNPKPQTPNSEPRTLNPVNAGSPER